VIIDGQMSHSSSSQSLQHNFIITLGIDAQFYKDWLDALKSISADEGADYNGHDYC